MPRGTKRLSRVIAIVKFSWPIFGARQICPQSGCQCAAELLLPWSFGMIQHSGSLSSTREQGTFKQLIIDTTHDCLGGNLALDSFCTGNAKAAFFDRSILWLLGKRLVAPSLVMHLRLFSGLACMFAQRMNGHRPANSSSRLQLFNVLPQGGLAQQPRQRAAGGGAPKVLPRSRHIGRVGLVKLQARSRPWDSPTWASRAL